MYKTKERFFIIPKKEFYNMNVACIKDFYKRFEDYEIESCTENAIAEAINMYNTLNDIKYFDRLKPEHFYFAKVTEIEIGKYKSGKIEALDMWKK